MSCKAMAQRVWRYVSDSRLTRIAFNQTPGELPAKLSAAVQEDIRRSNFSIGSFDCRVLLQPMDGALPNRYAPLFTSFTMTDQEPRHDIQIGLFQGGEFRNPQAGGIHQFKHGAIANALFRRYVRGGEQTIDLFFSKKIWQISETLRSIEFLSR